MQNYKKDLAKPNKTAITFILCTQPTHNNMMVIESVFYPKPKEQALQDESNDRIKDSTNTV